MDAPSRSENPTPVFRMEAVTKTYRMGEVDVRALAGIDLALRPREFVVLLGPSGSGKSTLLNLLGGLDVPSSGRIFFRDEELTRAGRDRLTEFRRAHIGFVFQFYNLIPSLTARENVALVTDLAADPMEPAQALEQVGLGDRLDHFPSQLSGDVKTGRRVLQALLDTHQVLGTTTAVITHNAAIARMADRVISLAGGVIADDQHNAQPEPPEAIAW